MANGICPCGTCYQRRPPQLVQMTSYLRDTQALARNFQVERQRIIDAFEERDAQLAAQIVQVHQERVRLHREREAAERELDARYDAEYEQRNSIFMSSLGLIPQATPAGSEPLLILEGPGSIMPPRRTEQAQVILTETRGEEPNLNEGFALHSSIMSTSNANPTFGDSAIENTQDTTPSGWATDPFATSSGPVDLPCMHCFEHPAEHGSLYCHRCSELDLGFE